MRPTGKSFLSMLSRATRKSICIHTYTNPHRHTHNPSSAFLRDGTPQSKPVAADNEGSPLSPHRLNHSLRTHSPTQSAQARTTLSLRCLAMETMRGRERDE
eukprot:GHVU01008535.1.p3 GENE.GHVU01008535.1~~GHVU01008535.1.p3  ORF type:complete len:101 (-),score=1.54 GHVU01008535.1:230-532(-)